uniref:Histone acetyltransferase HAC1 n=1 Tax=Rhizophora mucronata TaxID=61149 RepID=A0A2P2MUJ1_RHIMU
MCRHICLARSLDRFQISWPSIMGVLFLPPRCRILLLELLLLVVVVEEVLLLLTLCLVWTLSFVELALICKRKSLHSYCSGSLTKLVSLRSRSLRTLPNA